MSLRSIGDGAKHVLAARIKVGKSLEKLAELKSLIGRWDGDTTFFRDTKEYHKIDLYNNIALQMTSPPSEEEVFSSLSEHEEKFQIAEAVYLDIRSQALEKWKSVYMGAPSFLRTNGKTYEDTFIPTPEVERAMKHMNEMKRNVSKFSSLEDTVIPYIIWRLRSGKSSMYQIDFRQSEADLLLQNRKFLNELNTIQDVLEYKIKASVQLHEYGKSAYITAPLWFYLGSGNKSKVFDDFSRCFTERPMYDIYDYFD